MAAAGFLCHDQSSSLKSCAAGEAATAKAPGIGALRLGVDDADGLDGLRLDNKFSLSSSLFGCFFKSWFNYRVYFLLKNRNFGDFFMFFSIRNFFAKIQKIFIFDEFFNFSKKHEKIAQIP